MFKEHQKVKVSKVLLNVMDNQEDQWDICLLYTSAIPLTFLTRAFLSSLAEAVTAMVLMLVCSFSIGSMAIASAVSRSVRSWSHFNVTLDLALCKSAQILNYLSMQITGSNLEMKYSYKKGLASQDLF